jgi:hypothetical protein
MCLLASSFLNYGQKNCLAHMQHPWMMTPKESLFPDSPQLFFRAMTAQPRRHSLACAACNHKTQQEQQQSKRAILQIMEFFDTAKDFHDTVAATKDAIESGTSKVLDHKLASFGICFNPKYLLQHLEESKLSVEELNKPLARALDLTIFEYVAVFPYDPHARHASLKILLEAKADVHASSRGDKCTALHHLLLNPGCNDSTGITAQTVKLLLDHGAKWSVDAKQWTPLMALLGNEENLGTELAEELVEEFYAFEAQYHKVVDQDVYLHRLRTFQKRIHEVSAVPEYELMLFWSDMPTKSFLAKQAGRLVERSQRRRPRSVTSSPTKRARTDSDEEEAADSKEPKASTVAAATAAVEEPDVGAQMRKLFGPEVSNRFFVQYDGLHRGDSCSRGYGSMIRPQVDPVVRWYTIEGNREKLDALCKANPDDSEVRFFKEFKEMWIDAPRYEQERACKIARSMDAGAAMAMAGGRMSQGGLYRSWKSGYEPSTASMRRAEEPCIIS